MKRSIKICGMLLVITLVGSMTMRANGCARADTSLSAELQHQLQNAAANELYFPKTVQRFYENNHYQKVWFKPQNSTGQTWRAMLMIDCVLQFGLSHADYHPHELMYNRLHDLFGKAGEYLKPGICCGVIDSAK